MVLCPYCTFVKLCLTVQNQIAVFEIQNIYNFSTGGKCDEISTPKLIEFLNEKQRDPRLNEILYPHYNANRVKEIITAYEPDQDLVKRCKKCLVYPLTRIVIK